MSHKAPYLYFLFFLFQGKEGSLAHKFAGGKGEDNGVKIMVCGPGRSKKKKEVSPFRGADNRKAKLPKFEQSVLNF